MWHAPLCLVCFPLIPSHSHDEPIDFGTRSKYRPPVLIFFLQTSGKGPDDGNPPPAEGHDDEGVRGAQKVRKWESAEKP